MIFPVVNTWCLASGVVKARTSILGGSRMEQNRTEQNRSRVAKKEKKVSFLSATTSDGLFKTPTSVTTKTQQKEE